MTAIPIPRAMAPAQAAGGLTGADFLRVVRQRLVLILFLWLFFIVVTCVGTWLMVRYYPKFRATAYIRVQSISPVNPLDPLQSREVHQDEVERLLQDQALAVKSPDVLLKVLEDNEIRGTSWFQEAEEYRLSRNEDPYDQLSDIVSADPIRDSNYLAVTAAWKVPSEVAKLVNVTVERYMKMIEDQQKARIRTADDQLSSEVDRTKNLLDGKLRELEAYRSNEEVMGTSRDELRERLLTLTSIETELQMDMLGKRTQFEQLQNVNPDSLPITPDLQAMLNVDPRILAAEQRTQQLDDELTQAQTRFGPNHRIVQQLQASRDAAADRAASERVQKIIQYQNDQIDAARRNYLESQQQLLAVKERLQEARSEQKDKDAKYNAYLRLQEESEVLKKQLEQLQEQKTLLTMTLRQERTVQISVQSKAITPTRRSSPKYEIWIPAGVLLGLGLSVGFALLLELADKSVRTPRDVQRASIPVLATIPATEDDEIEITRVETAALDAPHSITAEAFRNLRANLFFTAPAEQQGVVLVTSPSGQNGKTTVATNLAISIALSGRRVLLVDANFRRPSLIKIFPELREEGLSNVLIGQAHLDDVVTSTSVPGLDVLNAGPLPPNPAELLGSSYLRDMLVDARARYDQVIIDGPPVLLVSDAMVLAGAVDGVLLVCQYRATSRGALQRTQQQLDAINARIFGAVLNRVETRAGGYFRKAYREFYEYHEPAEQDDQEAEKKLASGEESDQIAHAEGEAPPTAEGDAAGEVPALGSEIAAEPSSEDVTAVAATGVDPLTDFAGEDSTQGAGASATTERNWADADIDAEIDSLGGDRILDAGEDLDVSPDGEEPGSQDDPNRPRD